MSKSDKVRASRDGDQFTMDPEAGTIRLLTQALVVQFRQAVKT